MKKVAFYVLIVFFTTSFQNKGKEVLKTYFPDGSIKSITEVENGMKNGKEELYWDNGNIFMVQNFKDDLPVDSFYQFKHDFPNELLLKGYNITKANTFVIDTLGSVVSENYFKAKMIADGPIKQYSTNGNVISITEYKNGKRHGVSLVYYPNGNIRSVEHYKNGEKTAHYIEFSKNGEMTKYVPAE